MEQHRDPQLSCADCGASFVFSAAEAAVFAERGLTPPKRCKDCRRARKERAGQSGGHPGHAGGQGGHHAHGGNGHAAGNWAPRPRRYTGDVNEYRSPMADSYSPSPYGMPARGGGSWQTSGEYRSPMSTGRTGSPTGESGPPAGRSFRGNANVRAGGPRIGKPGRGPSQGASAPPRAEAEAGAKEGKPRARRRPPAETFAIQCSACGAQAEVPFKPAEGREVFCPTCYKARRAGHDGGRGHDGG